MLIEHTQRDDDDDDDHDYDYDYYNYYSLCRDQVIRLMCNVPCAIIGHVTGMATNDVIRTQVVRNYRQFVADVDPNGGIMDHLIETGVVSIETKERIASHVTRQVLAC